VTLELSDVEGVYGTVTIEDTPMRVLFTDIPDKTKPPGITIVNGVGSVYKYFIFVPVEVFEALVEVRGERAFREALHRLCVSLYQGET